VLIPPLTFAATASVVRKAGLKIGVADIDPKSWLGGFARTSGWERDSNHPGAATVP